MNEGTKKRLLEVIPGLFSWTVIAAFVCLLLIKPELAALILIVYLLYLTARFVYMTLLLLLAHRRVVRYRNIVWSETYPAIETDLTLEQIVHVVLYPVYNEPEDVIERSLAALMETDYNHKKIVVVLAGEEREDGIERKLNGAKKKWTSSFFDILITIHPKDIKGEIPAKGANATYAAKKVKAYLETKGYNIEHVVISCFDSDTKPSKCYFSCLTYHFLTHPRRHQISYQPFPIYSNNIFEAPSFARIIEMGSTFWQLIESMKFDKFITFSSHSMSFKTLVDVGYWPVDMISDDSVIFWKCFLHFNGEYQTYPLEVPVYMDIACGQGLWDTIKIQYRQKRRWAWGVENFVYVCMGFMSNKKITLSKKMSRVFQLLDNHIHWATWAIIVSFFTPLIMIWAQHRLQKQLIFFNLSYINGMISNLLLVILVLCVVMSKQFLPSRPHHVSRWFYVSYILQWLLLPMVSAVLGSIPALDAQTRLMFGRYLSFHRTPKEVKKT
ncbi:MAG: hypothetical protein JW938_07560 [Candidatus Omnitrophica bacterium]|nr:hypothetical protein [Candidatus Omnitrophota bacterium]